MARKKRGHKKRAARLQTDDGEAFIPAGPGSRIITERPGPVYPAADPTPHRDPTPPPTRLWTRLTRWLFGSRGPSKDSGAS